MDWIVTTATTSRHSTKVTWHREEEEEEKEKEETKMNTYIVTFENTQK